MKNAMKGFVEQPLTEEYRQRIIKAVGETIDSLVETDVNVTLTETDDPNVLGMTLTKSVKLK